MYMRRYEEKICENWRRRGKDLWESGSDERKNIEAWHCIKYIDILDEVELSENNISNNLKIIYVNPE